VSLPLFDPTKDPGPSFLNLLKYYELGTTTSRSNRKIEAPIEVVHGTTVLAFKYKDGIIMAGDRRATEANRIAHRYMEKVFPADSHSAIAIAGAAGFAVEMVKLFQTQLAHFEKVEGIGLSLEGKANQLSQLVRSNLEMAMMGLAVVPLFGGYDLAESKGRIFSYDLTGGHYEEIDFQATGSGGRDAKSIIKQGFAENMEDHDAIVLALKALLGAADEDTATGGPDLTRGIFPVVALVSQEGYKRIEDSQLREILESLNGAQ
jgi:proteasome beta subunit